MMAITSDSNSKSVISVTSFSIRRQIRRHPPLSPDEERRPAAYHQWQCHGYYTGILRRCGGIRICASQPSHPILRKGIGNETPANTAGQGPIGERQSSAACRKMHPSRTDADGVQSVTANATRWKPLRRRPVLSSASDAF